MRTATIYNFLLEANLMASIAIVLMLIVRKCFRRQLGNRVVYFAWLLIAIRLLCPLALPNPAINQIRPYFENDQAIRPIAGQLKVRFADLSEDVSMVVSNAVGNSYNHPAARAVNRFTNANYDGSLSYHLMVVYLLGAGGVLGWFAVANLRFRHRMKADRIEPISGDLLESYTALCKARGVKPVPVYFTDPLPSACLVGTFKPYIALPLTSKPQETIQVLTHEVSHLKGHDNLWGVLRLLCCAIHWFNPLVWLGADMSRTDGELACDDRAVAPLSPKEKMDYANVLVLAAAKRNAPGVAVLATGMTMTGKRLKTRVNAILHSGHVKKGLAIAFSALACVALLGAFATAEYTVWPAIPVYEDAVTIVPRTITSEEEAIAYAQAIWHSPYLAEDTSGATWAVEVFPMGDGELSLYQVSATTNRGLGGGLMINCLSDGRITKIENYNCGYNIAGAAGELFGQSNPEKTAELHAFTLRAFEQLAPGQSIDTSEIRNSGNGSHSNNNEYYTDFIMSDGTNRHAYNFGVQIIPTVRIVNYEWDYQNSLMVLDELNAEPAPIPTAPEYFTPSEPLATPASTVAPTGTPLGVG